MNGRTESLSGEEHRDEAASFSAVCVHVRFNSTALNHIKLPFTAISYHNISQAASRKPDLL